MSEESNPALVPNAADAAQEKQYKVTGTQPVFGHKTGEVFAATLSAEQEAYFTEYGHLEVTTESAPQQQGDNDAPGEEQSESTTDEGKE